MIRFYRVESHTFMEKINPKIRGRNLTLPPLHPVVIWMAKLEKVKAVYICRFDDYDGQIVEYFLLYNSISVCTFQNFSSYLGTTACAVVMQEKKQQQQSFFLFPVPPLVVLC